MLSKEEVVAFLTLLLTFVDQTRLSANAVAALFGISHPTAARWLKAARALPVEPTATLYHHMADPVAKKIERLNTLNTERRMFEAVEELPARERLDALKMALRGHVVW